MPDHVGHWCVRQRRGKWHYIESQIAERYVTHCGRELDYGHDDGVLLFEPRPSWGPGICSGCTKMYEPPTLMTRGDAS